MIRPFDEYDTYASFLLNKTQAGMATRAEHDKLANYLREFDRMRRQDQRLVLYVKERARRG